MNVLPFNITDKAIDEIILILSSKNIPKDYCLRVGIKGSGCSGTNYFIGFDKREIFDQFFTYKNINILIDKKHFLYLASLEIDFVENENEKGFVFVNSNII